MVSQAPSSIACFPHWKPVWSDPVWVYGLCPKEGRFLAVVGSRTASKQELEKVSALAEQLGRQGFVIVSGGALGIDAAAHRGALAAGCKTVAVLGTGVDVAYPARHRGLFQEMVRKGGALVSPFPPGTQPLRWHFPKRNGLIAALCEGVLVASAEARSGALSTARAAQKLGRRVMAIPGTPGCDALLLAGAYAVEQVSEILGALSGQRRGRTPPQGELGLVLEACGAQRPLSVEEVAARAGLSLGASHAALLRLTLMRYVARLPGERYQRLDSVSP